MDTKFIHSLIEVIRLGSIAGAARSLNLTPAAVGQRVKALENELKTELLIRTGHKAKPTETCIHLLPQMREIVLKCQDLEHGLDPGGVSGVLRVGAISTALTGLVSSAIKRLRQDYPQMQIHLFPGTSKELYQRVTDGDLDLAVIVSPPVETEKSLVTEILCRERLVFVSPSTSNCDLELMLRTEPFIAYDPVSWGGLIIQKYLKKKGVEPTIVSVLDSPEAIANLVSAGFGVSIIPDWIGLETQTRNIRLTALPDDLEQRVISTIHRQDCLRRKKIDLFNDILSDVSAYRSRVSVR